MKAFNDDFHKAPIKNHMFRLVVATCLFVTVLALTSKPGLSISPADSLRHILSQAVNESEKIKLLHNLCIYWVERNPDSTLHYSGQLADVSKKLNNVQEQSLAYCIIAYSFYNKGLYDEAIKNAQIGLSLSTGEDLQHRRLKYLTLLGEIYRAAMRYDDAINYLQRAINEIPGTDSFKLAESYNRLGAIYFEVEDYGRTKEYADSSMKYIGTNGYTDILVNNLELLGATYRENGEYMQATLYLKKALQMLQTDENLTGQPSILNNIAGNYFAMKQFDSAIIFAGKSFEIAREKDIKSLLVTSAELLARSFAEKGDFKKAYEHERVYDSLRGELFSEERDKQISEMSAKYETRQKEQEILLQKSLLKKKDLKLQKNKVAIIVFILFLAALALLLFAVARARNKLNKANVDLRARNLQIEQQRMKLEDYALEIRRAYEKLQELTKFKQTMTGMLVHDLKNPLNLLANINSFREENRSAIVSQTSKQMLILVMNMLDIHKAEECKLELEKKEVHLNQILKRACNDVLYHAHSKNIEVEIQTGKDYIISCDPDTITRVFINLLTNSIRHSPPNGIIQIGMDETANNKLIVSVKDDGTGIAPEHHKSIFEKFTTVKNNTVENTGSTGLGLAFCKAVVEAHTWHIEVDSELGKGSEFRIVITGYMATETDFYQNLKSVDKKKVAALPKPLNPEEKQIVLKYIRRLKKLNIHSITGIKTILAQITAEQIASLTGWIADIRDAAEKMNEKEYESLIRSIENECS